MKVELLRYNYKGDRIGMLIVNTGTDSDLAVLRDMLGAAAKRALNLGEECTCYVEIGRSEWSHIFSVRNARVNHIGEDAAY